MHDVGAELAIECEKGQVNVLLQAVGLHNVRNALAAAAATLAVHVDLAAIKAGLENFTAVKGRMQCKTTRNGGILIDDSYNANPDSVRAAIDVLARMKRPAVLVLGDMGEVGEQGHAFHTEIGQYARQAGIDAVYTLGNLSSATCEAFGEDAEHFTDVDTLLAKLEVHLQKQASLLVKGSRFMRMERIVEKVVN
jgi:UDP-N-acetylmuramoyl-tripeptide--D-alanyl-D-alanine ligase